MPPILRPAILRPATLHTAHCLRPRNTPRSPHLHPRFNTFFSLPNLLPTAALAKEHSQRHVLPYSPRQLYDLVSDVDQYHHFVPWCASSRVLSVHPNQNGKVMRAELGIGFKALSETYVSRVECVDGVSVKALAQDSSVFRQLNTTWKFTPVRPTHNTKLPPSFPQSTAAPASSPFDTPTCAVDFHIAFEFKSPLYAQVSTLFFEEVSKAMMGAFEDRARVVYGRPKNLVG